ncbi:hypothetical protein [Myxosarcina sp. GI1]|uniref:hypothetical protein n=1 Tax=Myxosarcina sp. GI1 TaxID=1541065 RepID=UPI00155B2964|nr:hypothetical protein [Myxosarcina sp. GI1]
MIISSNVRRITEYFAEAFLELFGPSHDDYPAVGIQPFSGTITQKKRKRSIYT